MPPPSAPCMPAWPRSNTTPTPYPTRTRGGAGWAVRPGKTEIYVHLTDHTLATGTGVLRAEGIGPLLADQLSELVGHGPYVVKPVIDLNDAVSVDAYEIPDRTFRKARLLQADQVDRGWAAGAAVLLGADGVGQAGAFEAFQDSAGGAELDGEVVGDVLGGEAVGEGGGEFAHPGEGLGVETDAAGQQREALRCRGRADGWSPDGSMTISTSSDIETTPATEPIEAARPTARRASASASAAVRPTPKPTYAVLCRAARWSSRGIRGNCSVACSRSAAGRDDEVPAVGEGGEAAAERDEVGGEGVVRFGEVDDAERDLGVADVLAGRGEDQGLQGGADRVPRRREPDRRHLVLDQVERRTEAADRDLGVVLLAGGAVEVDDVVRGQARPVRQHLDLVRRQLRLDQRLQHLGRAAACRSRTG